MPKMRIEKNESPLVTVIIPTYNRAKSIQRAIKSVFNQNYQNFEIIVVDDSSSDNTSEIIKEMNDKRIVFLQNEINSGAQYSRIKGIQESKGEYIVFLDSDDELLDTSISSRLNVFLKDKNKNHNDTCNIIGLVYGDALIKIGERVLEFKTIRKSGYVYKYLTKELSLCPYSVIMIKRDCINATGLPDMDFPAWQDDDMVLTIGKYYSLSHCNEFVANMHQTPNSIVTNIENIYKGCRKMIIKYQNDMVKNNGRIVLLFWKIRLARIKILKRIQNNHSNKKNFLFKVINKIYYLISRIYFDKIYS